MRRDPKPDRLPSKRFTLQVHITSDCNNRCRHCYQAGVEPRQMALRDFRLLMDQYVDLLARLGHAQDVPWSGLVTVTGGEPLKHPLFAQMVFECMTRDLPFAVLTNGSLLTQATAALLRGASFVQVSLDGLRGTHDAIRGAGDYDRTLAAIRLLKDAGCNPMVSFTACAENYRDLPRVAREAKRAGAAHFWSDRYLPLSENASMTPLSADQTREYLKVLGRAAKMPFGIVSRRRALQFMCGGEPYRCHAARNLLAVDEGCRVLACRRLPVAAGDFRETPLADLYFDHPALVELRRAGAPEACKGCAHEAECAGGLRCLAAAQSGDWRLADPGCPLARRPE